MSTTVAIPFVRVDPSQNPNLVVQQGRDAAEPYFKAMTVAFASVRRWQPTACLEFISNSAPPPVYQEQFAELGVDVRLVPFDHQPPEGFAQRFTASLYLLDALGSLSAEKTLLIDPDVLCIGPLDAMLEVSEGKVGVIRMDFPEDENINGITRAQAGELHTALGEPEHAPDHYGGEAYLVPRGHLDALRERSEKAWDFTLTRHHQGLTKFTTEEHILSYALRGVPVAELSAHMRRIWTTHRYRQVRGNEHELLLWHLPAEKDRGFRQLYAPATDQNSWFWNAPRAEFVDRCGRAMGFHHRTAPRYAKDFAGRAANLAQRALRR